MFKVIFLSLVAAGLAEAAVASERVSEASRASNAEYLQAARCAGLVRSMSPNRSDVRAVDAFLVAQSRRRNPIVLDMADKRFVDVHTEAVRGGLEKRAALLAEREGVCRSYGA
ncbi:MAG: hypothetical protein IT546_00810 [Caulobacteraceae bacterium]|nr:hypothetical protein [Caulobacteraceae bacterium]